MRYRHKRAAYSWLRSFCLWFFGRCGRCIGKHFLPVLLCCVLIAAPATIKSYAVGAEGTDDINAMDLTYHSLYYVNGVQQPLPVVRYSGDYYGKQCVKYQCPLISSGTQGYNHKGVLAYTLENFVGNHEYHLNFDFLIFKAGASIFSVYLRFKDGNGNEIRQQNIYMNGDLSDETWYTVDVNFIANTSNISSGYTVELCFEFVDSYYSQNDYCISQQIYLNDNDDDKSLLDSILSWLSRIYHSIAGGTDRDGVTHTGLVAGIQSALTSLGNNLNTWLTGVKDGITNKLESVKTSITTAISNIQQWFIDLKDNLINGMKSLFIPSDGYFEQKKQQLTDFFTQHFGAVFQVTDVAVDFIRMLTNINPAVNPQITVPAIEFTWGGETVHLSDSFVYSFAWVNDASHPLHYFYLFYRGFATLILFFAFFGFCHKKLEQILEIRGSDSE